MGKKMFYINEVKARWMFLNKRWIFTRGVVKNAGCGCTGGVKGMDELVLDAVVSL